METEPKPKPQSEGTKKPNLVYFLAILSAWEQNLTHTGAIFSPVQPPSASASDPINASPLGITEGPVPPRPVTGQSRSRSRTGI
jgi:hypothetical protein